MTKATTQITDKFKRTYLHCVTPGSFEDAQRLMFKMGFKWVCETQKVSSYGYGTYLYVDNDNRLMWSDDATGPYPYPLEELPLYREITMDDLKAALELFTLAKRQDSKASKKRRALRKWEATAIKNDGTQPEGIVTVKFNCGKSHTSAASDWYWGVGDEAYKIASYKVHTPNKHKPKTVSSDDMFAAICDDLGKGIAMQVGSLSALGSPVGTLSVVGSINPDAIKSTIPQDWVIDTNGKVVMEGSFVNEVPDTNPKKQYGLSAIPLEMWPDLASAYGALALYNGSLKYGKANFANTPVEASIYIAALRRHLASWVAGEEFDPVDGVPHLGGVLANAAILLSARAAGTLIDDRMLLDGYLKERDALKALVAPIQAVHAGKNPKHYTRDGA